MQLGLGVLDPAGHQIWGPLCEEGGRLLGPFSRSQAAAQASWLSPSFWTLPLLHSILKHELDHDSVCDSPM